MGRLLLSALVVLLLGCPSKRIADLSSTPHFESRVTTSDGWEIALFRIPARGTPRGMPVLLVHGTGVNRHNFLVEGSNLADYLAGRGFDVWLMEHRGDRTSVPPSTAVWNRGAWTVDDIAEQDVPAAIGHVLKATGAPRLLWVGHSLGGILGYITLQGPSASKVAGLVSIAAPGDFRHPNDLALRFRRGLKFLPQNQQVPVRNLGMLGRGVLERDPDNALLHAVFEHSNVDKNVLIDWIPEAMENVGRGVVQQYAGWIESGSLTSADGSVNYTDGLARIDAPVLFFAGRVDHIIPPWTVRRAYDLVGSTDKEYVTLGVGWGTKHEYGHGGPVAGDYAESELFGRIGDWLESRASTKAAPAPSGAGLWGSP